MSLYFGQPTSAVATSSFENPVPVNTTDPDAEPLVCVQFNADWLPIIIGALMNLIQPRAYASDDDTVIDLQQQRAATLIRLFQEQTACAVATTALRGMEVSDDMSGLRVDCDCNVWITCCDGTEKQLLTSDQVKKLINPQPGGGSIQPTPGGGTASYGGNMPASEQFLIPTPVSTGDVITVTATGSTNDPDTDPYLWRCPDGEEMFAGGCVGFPHITGSDPVVAANHMALIIGFNGTFYALTSPFTVPSGISNVQPVLQVNDTDISNDHGSLQVDVTVTNNGLLSWTHTFDFTLGPQGFEAYTVAVANDGAQWLGGSGWNDVTAMFGGPDTRNRNYFHRAGITAFHLTALRVDFDWTTGGIDDPAGVGQQVTVYDGGGHNIILNDSSHFVTGAGAHIEWSGSLTNITNLLIAFDSGFKHGAVDPGGSSRVWRLTVSGDGPNPFV